MPLPYQQGLRTLPSRRADPMGDYTAILNLIVKVLDFVQLGGPDLTVGSTVFELLLAL